METQYREGNHKHSTRSNWIIGLALVVLGGIFLLAQTINSDDLIWSVALLGAGLTFGVVFLTGPRERWWALIPGYILAMTGAFLLVEPMLPGNWDGIYWVAGVGLPFLVVYVVNPRNWWALIPAGVMGGVAGFMVLEPILPGDLDAVYWMAFLGIPFFIVFATNPRQRWWALIPAYVFASVGAFLLLEPLFRGPNDLEVTYWTWAVAAPFLFVFLTKPGERWWALIPGGIFGAIGLGFLIAEAEIIIPVVLIGGGLILLGRTLFKRERAVVYVEPSEERPLTGPEADRPQPEYEPIGTRGSGPDADHA